MEVVKVLGLQLCLLAFSLGSEISYQSSFFDTESHMEQNSAQQPPFFETYYGTLHKPEAPEFGLEMKYQALQDYDIMVMKHKTFRIRRSDRKNQKRTRISFPRKSQDGKTTPAVVRAKRQLDKSGKQQKKHSKPRPGTYSVVGSKGPTQGFIQ